MTTVTAPCRGGPLDGQLRLVRPGTKLFWYLPADELDSPETGGLLVPNDADLSFEEYREAEGLYVLNTQIANRRRADALVWKEKK